MIKYFGWTKTDRFGIKGGICPYTSWVDLRKQVKKAKENSYQYTIHTTPDLDYMRSKIYLEAQE